MFNRIAEWFSTGLEQALQISKVVSLIATIVGAYYFGAYLAALGVPFPTDFAVLPSVLLTVGVVTVGITAIVFGYLLLAGWVQTDPLNMGYAELFHLRPSGVIGHGGRAAAGTVIAVFIVPYLAWVVMLLSPLGKQAESAFYWLLVAFAIWASLIAVIKVRERFEKSNCVRYIHFAKITVSVFLLSAFTVLSSCIYIILLRSRGLMKSFDEIAISLFFFGLLNVGVVYPTVDVKSFKKLNEDAFNGESLKAHALIKKVYKTPVFISVGILLLITIFPPFSAYVGELPTKVLGLSSNTPRLIYTDAKTATAWPPELMGKCDVASCRSVPVIVALDLGKYLYVRPLKGGDLYRVERKGIVERFSYPKNGSFGNLMGSFSGQPDTPADARTSRR